jgi:pimeloyl-ACP methyl ester carboxylesterase
LAAFVDDICEDMDNNRAVAVADVAYANGAEPRFVRQLLARADITRLAGYAAWNTAGNSLGSAVAAGICALHGQNKLALASANFSRLIDDYLYQATIRRQVWDALPKPNPFDLGEQKPLAEAEIERRVAPAATELFAQHFAPRLNAKLVWGGSSLAWNRLFTGVFRFEIVPI